LNVCRPLCKASLCADLGHPGLLPYKIASA
jgi:hypothetical protein